jgi:predicted outer membrane protein
MKRYFLGAAAALLLGGPAAAQMQAQMAPAGAPMMAPMSGTQFRQMAMFSDAFEIESSQLALQRSRNPSVRRYAQLMIRDHSATTQALGGPAPMAAAPGGPVGAVVAAPFQAAGAVAGAVTGAPTGGGMAGGMALDPRHAQMLNQLAATSGRSFDATYAQMQVMAHQEAVGMFAAYAQAGDQPALRNFAGQVLPNLQHHLAMAQRLSGRRS